MDILEIMNTIPHRYPFLLIDKVLEIEEGVRVKALKNVTINEPFFIGHFPEKPVMPGVLVVEAMAQAGAIAILKKEEFKGKTAYLGGIDNAKFRKMITPGDTLIFEVEIVKLRQNAGIGRGICYLDGKKAVEAEITFIIG